MNEVPTETKDKTFEQRRFELLKQKQAAYDVGRVAISGYERRHYDEITSGLAEALSGAVSTHYTFELKSSQLVAEDGEPIEELMLRGLHKDIKKASKDPFFEFLPQRSRAELDNFRYAQAMANGEVEHNTLLEISVLTEELNTSETNRKKLIEAAQKPYWGRTMTRLSHWDGEKLHIFTMSSDNLPASETYGHVAPDQSSLSLFQEAAKRKLNYQFKATNSGDMLAEPIRLKIEDNSWKTLASDIITEVDKILAEHHGGIWRQGRPEVEAIDLQKYVESQKTILDGLFRAEKRIAKESKNQAHYQRVFERELYNCIALLEMRLQQGRPRDEVIDYEAASVGAGAIAQAEGKVFDMCGELVVADQANVATQTGSETLERLINKKIHCPECTKEVVVPKDDLQDGKLSCRECGYWLDVCTGERGFAKKNEKTTDSELSGWDIIAEWFRKDRQDREIKKAAEQQAISELGDDITYLDKKNYEKRIRKSFGLAA